MSLSEILVDKLLGKLSEIKLIMFKERSPEDYKKYCLILNLLQSDYPYNIHDYSEENKDKKVCNNK